MIGEGDAELTGHERGIAGGDEEMIETSEQLLARGVIDGETTADARAKGQELGRAETLGQSRVAGEDDAEELFAIELFAGQDAQLAEDSGEGLLGLVDDEDGAAATGGDVIGPAASQGFETGPAIVRGQGDGEEIAELAIEVHGAALGMLDGADEDVGQCAKPLGEQAQGDAFPRARVAGEHGETAVGDAELDAADEAVDGRGGEECLVGHVGTKGVKFQSIERKQFAHESSGESSVELCLGR